MKHPKTHIIARLRHLANQAADRAHLRDQQDQERHDESMERHTEAAPQVHELLANTINLLASPLATADDYEQAKTLMRRAERAFNFGSIPRPAPDNNHARHLADDLTAAADLLEKAEGETVTTSELERLGILAHLKV